MWLWLTNVAILLGAQLDAELARTRAVLAGLPENIVPYLPVRDIPDTEPPRVSEPSQDREPKQVSESSQDHESSQDREPKQVSEETKSG